MSKNLTRKGIAFGALVALGTSVIAGTPAFAAERLTLSPSAGTSYNTLSTSTFTLETTFDSAVGSAASAYLKYNVANAGENGYRFQMAAAAAGTETFVQTSTASTGATNSTFTVTDWSSAANAVATTHETVTLTLSSVQGIKVGDLIDGASLVLNDDAASTPDTTVGDAVETLINAGDLTVYSVSLANKTITIDVGNQDQAGVTAIASSAATGSGSIVLLNVVNDDAFVVNPQSLGTAGQNDGVFGYSNTLAIDTLKNNGDSSITVQAWLDTDNDNTIDAGEDTSAVRTVSFKDVSKLSATVAINTPIIGATAVNADVTLTGDINYQQVAQADVTVTLAQTGETTITTSNNVTWNSTSGTFRKAFSAAAAAAGDVFTATVLVDNDFDGSVDDSKATATGTTQTEVTNPTVDFRVVNSATALTVTPAQTDAGTAATGYTAGAGVAKVRTGSGTFTAKLFLGTDVATPIAIASKAVVVTVSSSGVTNLDLVTVGGKALVSGAGTYTASTDASGYITFDVALASADAGDQLTFTPSINGTSVNALVVDVTDGTYKVVSSNPGGRSIKAGETFALNYKVVDEFGVAPANNTHSVVVTPNTNERTTAADFAYTIPVVDGLATATIKDNGAGTGKFTTTAKVVLNNTTSAIGSSVDSVIYVVADATPAKITLKDLTYGTSQKDATVDPAVDNTAKLLLSGKTFVDYDSRTALPTATAATVTTATKVVVSGTVANAAAGAVAGTPVTLAAKGFQFFNGTYYAQDTITVYTGSTGTFSVDVWSNVGGAQSIVITAGAATVSQALTYAAGTATAATFTVVTSVASVVPGRTVDVTVNVKDKFGNAAQGVTVALKSTGAGYLQATTGTTDVAGNVVTKLISGVQDGGVATITATVAIAGVDTAKTAAVNVALPEVAATITGATAKISYTVDNAKGELVIIKVGNKTVKTFTAYSNAHAFGIKAAKGSQAVKVYVAGDLVAAKTVSVK